MGTPLRPDDSLVAFVKSHPADFTSGTPIDKSIGGIARKVSDAVAGPRSRVFHNPRPGDRIRNVSTGVTFHVTTVRPASAGKPKTISYEGENEGLRPGRSTKATISHGDWKSMLGGGSHEVIVPKHKSADAGDLEKAVKKPVAHPGARGGRGYYDSKGWHYGELPKGHKDRRVATGSMDEHGAFTMDSPEKIIEAVNGKAPEDTRLKNAIKLAGLKTKDLGGIPHYVIEHGFPSGDKDNPAAGGATFDVVYATDAFDEIRGYQQAGQQTLAVYTARGRKLNPNEFKALRSRSDDEIATNTERAKELANKEGKSYGVMALTPKGGRTVYNTFPLEHKDRLLRDTRAMYPGIGLRQVGMVHPDDLGVYSKPAKPAAAKKSRTKQSGYQMADTEYEQRREQELTATTKPKKRRAPVKKSVEDGVAPVMAEDSALLKSRFLAEGPRLGDTFETVPQEGFSYKSVGSVVEIHPNGMTVLEHAPYGEPLRREVYHKGELVRSLNLGKMRLVEAAEPVEAAVYVGPVCRKCGQPESVVLPNSGYCNRCLTPAAPRWW